MASARGSKRDSYGGRKAKSVTVKRRKASVPKTKKAIAYKTDPRR